MLYSTYANGPCADSNLIESKTFDINYCFVSRPPMYGISSNKYNCDGTVNFYSDTKCTTLLAANNVISSTPNNQCLAVTSGNGGSKFYSCNDNSLTYPTSSWIAITAYNDASCTAGSSGWVSYACGSCMPLGNGAYYKLTCSQTAAGVDYRFANYTSSNCVAGLIYADPVPVPASLRPANTCTPRVNGNNLVEWDDFNQPFYAYATYSVVTGSTPPSPPYSGYLKV